MAVSADLYSLQFTVLHLFTFAFVHLLGQRVPLKLNCLKDFSTSLQLKEVKMVNLYHVSASHVQLYSY